MVCITLLLIEYRRTKKMLNVCSLFILPYFFIVLLNNLFFADRFNFYYISNNVIVMLLVAFLSFFLGVSFSHLLKKNKYTIKKYDAKKNFNIKHLKAYVVFVEIFLLIKALIIFKNHGIGIFINDSDVLISGIAGHLFLSIYAILPVFFYLWLGEKKKLSYLIIYLIGLGLATLSFVKYHVIGIVILTFIYIAIIDSKYLFKSVIVMIVSVILLFLGNYYFGFLFRNMLSDVDNDFYFLHLWKYIAGSVIHDNQIFAVGLNTDKSVLYKMLYCVTAIPNMFYHYLTGKSLNFDIVVPYAPVGSNGEEGNVIDFIGFMYHSGDNYIINACLWVLLLFLLGYIINNLFLSIKKKNSINLSTCVLLTFFITLSFFGVYSSLSAVWEIIIWALIIPFIFKKNTIEELTIYEKESISINSDTCI